MALRDSRGFKLCSWFLLALFVAANPAPIFAQSSGTKIPAGSTIQAKFPQAYEASDLSVGQVLNLVTELAVVVDGVEVIAAGAPVIAEVVAVTKPGIVGAPGKLSIAFKFVQATDGSRIPLSGSSTREGKGNVAMALVCTILCCILALLIKGADASVPMGTTVTAYTVSDAYVGS